MAVLDEPGRRRLSAWGVARDRPVGREEVARELGVSRALAAFHLDRLVEGGLLAADYRRLNERRGPGAGRPARVYWRAPREISVSLPERRYELAARVLAEALERAPRASRGLPDAARHVGRELGAAVGATRGEASLLATLDAQGYEPAAPDADGVVRLRNCPFHALVEEHRPLVCGMNLALHEGIAEATGGGAAYRPVLGPQPGFCCVALVPGDAPSP
jgi:predicted ArsR family transcriptional regulator